MTYFGNNHSFFSGSGNNYQFYTNNTNFSQPNVTIGSKPKILNGSFLLRMIKQKCTPFQLASLIEQHKDVLNNCSFGKYSLIEYTLKKAPYLAPTLISYMTNFYNEERGLIYAIKHKMTPIIEILLTKNITYNFDNFNNTLVCAVMAKEYDIVLNILSQKENKNLILKTYTKNSVVYGYEISLLHLAFLNNDMDMVLLLIENGANLVSSLNNNKVIDYIKKKIPDSSKVYKLIE